MLFFDAVRRHVAAGSLAQYKETFLASFFGKKKSL